MRTFRSTLVSVATLLLVGGMSGAIGAQTDTPDPMVSAAAEPGYPILEIVYVGAEPIPWVREGVIKKTNPHGVCDLWCIQLSFTISNRGTADFPPDEMTARSDRGGKLFWTVLFGGDGTRAPRETGQSTIYREYSFWYHDELTIPEGGVAKIVREFPVPTDVPLNEFTVVAWFVPPMTQYLGQDDDRTSGARVLHALSTARGMSTTAARHHLAIVDEREVTVVALDMGEVLSAHQIAPDRDYWRNRQRDPGRWPGSQATR
jgi:hypothetical protein